MTRVALPCMAGVHNKLFELIRDPLDGAGAWLAGVATSSINVGVTGLMNAGKTSLVTVRL